MIHTKDKFYENDGNQALLDLIPMDAGRLLDCGCGAGDNARYLKGKGWQVDGITLSPSEQQSALRYCSNVYITNLENGLPDILQSSSYNAVLLSHILEHLVDPARLLHDIKRTLKTDGVILVALPNVLTFTNRLRFMLGKFDYTMDGIMDETHLRFYSYSAGRRLLERNGFKVILAKADGRFPLWRSRDILPQSIVRKINQFTVRNWPGLFGIQSLYLAKPE